MKTWKKIVIGIGLLLVGLVGFAAWYRVHYAMDPAKPSEAGPVGSKVRVLVATQGSAFKDAVVRGVIARLEPKGAYVKVVDVSALADVREAEWTAIVVLHTWEMEKPPPPVASFVERTSSRDKLVVLTTSGNGGRKLAGVDAISTASALEAVDGKVGEITLQLEKRLGEAK